MYSNVHVVIITMVIMKSLPPLIPTFPFFIMDKNISQRVGFIEILTTY